MKESDQPGKGAGNHVATEQGVLPEKEWQISRFKVLKPYGKGLVDRGFGGQADGGEIEVRVVTRNQELGQTPEDKDKDEGPRHQKASVLLR
ncbi:MAG: hypothetical protein LAO76_02930 [Acidobacteriia bacterium]|nr:hypothetical protein [Terriglobia bacterium]